MMMGWQFNQEKLKSQVRRLCITTTYGKKGNAHNFRNARTMDETEGGKNGFNVKQSEKKFEAPSGGNPSDSKNTKDEVIDSLRKQLNEKNLLLNKLKARAKEFVAESNGEKKKLTTAIRSLQKQLQVLDMLQLLRRCRNLLLYSGSVLVYV